MSVIIVRGRRRPTYKSQVQKAEELLGEARRVLHWLLDYLEAEHAAPQVIEEISKLDYDVRCALMDMLGAVSVRFSPEGTADTPHVVGEPPPPPPG